MKIYYYSKWMLTNDPIRTFADHEIETWLLTQPNVIHTYNYLVVIVAKTLHLEKKIQLDTVVIDGVEYKFKDGVLRGEPNCIWNEMVDRNREVRYPG